jgi:hypothetical protein
MDCLGLQCLCFWNSKKISKENQVWNHQVRLEPRQFLPDLRLLVLLGLAYFFKDTDCASGLQFRLIL